MKIVKSTKSLIAISFKFVEETTAWQLRRLIKADVYRPGNHSMFKAKSGKQSQSIERVKQYSRDNPHHAAKCTGSEDQSNLVCLRIVLSLSQSNIEVIHSIKK